MRLISSLLGRGRDEQRFSLQDYFSMFSHGGHQYPVVSGQSSHQASEQIESSFLHYVQGAYKSNGIVFACMLARMMVFSETRFQWQRMRGGRPGELFGDASLSILERPWPNATTGELLSRMIQDADLTGNAFVVREPGRPSRRGAQARGPRLRRLRPDWVEIVLTAPPAEAVQSDIKGYLYHPGGRGSGEAEMFLPWEVAHWSPIPDPMAQYRGMSWLTPVLREIEADQGATQHKQKFFDNAATPNLAVSFKETVTKQQFNEFMEAMDRAHQGSRNAYKTLYLGGGADVKTIGADLSQLDFKVTQGAGETRIAAASGMHPVLVGLSEGLQGSSLNAGNFNSARRLTADKTMRPLLRGAAGALETVVNPPEGARLWYDVRDVEFFHDDRKDEAEIQRIQAFAIRQLLDSGYEADAAVEFIASNDVQRLVGEHTGLPSVQLQQGNAGAATPTDDPDQDDSEDE